MNWVEKKSALMEERLVEAELRDAKECECGERLTNDEIGDVCPVCGQTIADLSEEASFMASLPVLITPAIRAKRIH